MATDHAAGLHRHTGVLWHLGDRVSRLDEGLNVPILVGVPLVVVVDHPQTTYTHAALTQLAAAGAAVVICGRDHLPAAMILPFIRTWAVPR